MLCLSKHNHNHSQNLSHTQNLSKFININAYTCLKILKTDEVLFENSQQRIKRLRKFIYEIVNAVFKEECVARKFMGFKNARVKER